MKRSLVLLIALGVLGAPVFAADQPQFVVDAANQELAPPPTDKAQVILLELRLLGLNYDPKTQAFQVLLENVDHLVFQPTEIWVLEGENDSLIVEVVAADGGKEIIYVGSSGPPARRYEPVPSASSDR